MRIPKVSGSVMLKQASATNVAVAVLATAGIYSAYSYYGSRSANNTSNPLKVFSGGMGQSLTLQSSQVVSHNTRRLRFELPRPDALSGLTLTSALLTISWPKGSLLPVLRPYTPISDLEEPGFIDLLVKHYPNGKSSTHLHSLQPGQSLYFAFPIKGYFWTPNSYPHITLIAGGAGITPIYQLTQGILKNPEDKTKITLVFGVNTDADILLKKEFDEFQRRFPDRLKVVYTVSNPVENSPFRKGYVTKELLQEVIANGSSKDAKVFVCGPPAMEAALTGTGGLFGSGPMGILQQLGYSKHQIVKF